MRLNLYRLPLRIVLPLLILVLAMLSILASSLLHLHKSEKNILVSSEYELKQTMTLLQNSIEGLIQVNNWEGIHSLIALIGSSLDVKQALIIDEQDMIIVDNKTKGVGKKFSRLSFQVDLLQIRKSLVGIITTSDDQQLLTAYYPITLGVKIGEIRPRRTGILILQINLQRKKEINFLAVKQDILLLSSGTLITVILLIVLLYFIVNRRIAIMADTARKVAREDLSARSNLQGDDELAYLSSVLDRSTEVIQREHTKLSDINIRLNSLVNNMVDALVTINHQGFIESFNPAAEKLFGYPANEIIGKKVNLLMPESFAVEHDAYLQKYLNTGESVILGHGPREVSAKTKSGGYVPVDLALSEMFIGEQRYFIGIIRDISQRLKNRERLNFFAYHDLLTGLPNRRLFIDRLTHALDKVKRDNTLLAILFLDLDNFKQINDSLGHKVGDSVLSGCAQRIEAILRESDTVARMGGDEFAIILENIHAAKDIPQIANKILNLFALPIAFENHELFISLSIGISIYPDDATDGDALIRYADTAMYRAKEMGRSRFEFYTHELTSRAAARFSLSNDLRQALKNQEFELYYQPKVDLHTGHIVGLECLIRWNHPEKGLISPAEFIPILEETTLIHEVGDWIIQQAVAQSADWNRQGFQFPVAINLSAKQVYDKQLLERFKKYLAQYDCPVEMITAEVTESLLMENVQNAQQMFTWLQSLGIKIAIDDFGTGYSSLSYLKRFPVDILKIDRSFIKDLPHDQEDAFLVQAIISMADSLGLKVVAEGIETQQQCEFLSLRQCEQGQGYLFSKPLPANKVCTLFQQQFTLN